MTTNFIRAGLQLGAVGTTRMITITTAAAQQIFLGTGNNAMMVMNNGPNTCSWGDSAIAQGSGNLLFPYSSEEFKNLHDDFSLYFRADSTATELAVTEFTV